MQIFGETGKYANECLSNIGKAGQVAEGVSHLKKRIGVYSLNMGKWVSDPGWSRVARNSESFLDIFESWPQTTT